MAAKSWVREEEKKEKSKSRKNSPHDPDRKLRSSRLHPPSGPFFPRVHFSPLVLDPPRVLLRGVGILLMRRDALPERERRAGCELFARLVEGCPPREQKRATSDGASTAFPLPPLPLDHVIRPVPFHQKKHSSRTLHHGVSKTRRGSLRYYSRRRVRRPFFHPSFICPTLFDSFFSSFPFVGERSFTIGRIG